MNDKIQKKIRDAGCRLVKICFCILFLPVLFCVSFLDKVIPYYDHYRLATLLPNAILLVIGILALCIAGVLICKGRKFNGKFSEIVLDIFLVVIFVTLYFVNVYIARETVYYTGWDPEVVRGYAYLMEAGEPVDYDLYLIMYPNNTTISYVLGKLYLFAINLGSSYAYNYEFIWNQVGCALISIAGLATCCSVKKIVKNRITVYLGAGLYIVCIGLTPWKNIPYTDVYSMAFPILTICFYVYYRYCDNSIGRIIYLVLAFLSSGLGGLIKPTVYIALIAIMLAELGRVLFEKEHRAWKWLLAEIALLVIVICCSHYAERYMVQQLGLSENRDISATWHHYFYMGLNEDTTGGYNSDDCAMFGEFQDRSIKERNKAELDRAYARICERGLFGSLYFGLKKMVMTFNDGTFGWQLEGYYKSNFAPIARGGRITDMLRDIFWVNSRYSGRYNTFCQLIWIMVLTCLPGICLGRQKNIEMDNLFLIYFIGIFMYILLFEARARYLLCFVPVLIAQASLGLDRYSTCVQEWISDWRKRQYGRSKEDASPRVH